MPFYDDMAAMATELLTEFAQGTVLLKRTVTTPEENRWDTPTETVTSYALKATVRTVSQKYVDGTLILAGDRMVTFAVPSITPAMTDLLSIDGKDYAMKDLRPLPGAGTTVAYIAFIGA